MEKLEKHIRKTLGQREITPSPQAWERISVELEGEEKRNNKKFPFIAIAASVLAILALSILVFMVKSEDVKTDGLVDVEESNKPQMENDISVPTIINEKDGELVETNNKEIENTSVTNNGHIPVKNNNEVASIQSAVEPQEKVVLIADSEFSEDVITLKMNEVLAEVIAMENDSVQVTDAEIDSLLLIAQKQLLAEQMNPKTKDGEVDAIALLNEVELELLESDRNQLFDKLRESFFKLRTAVADRNK